MAVTLTATEPAFLAAANGRSAPVTPVWFMRQAGRYMAEYRALRARHTLLDICRDPGLSAEVTMQPVRALGVDAAILFADILLPLVPMGLDLAFVAGEGPSIAEPVRTAGDVARLRPIEPEESLAGTLDAIRLLRRELPAEVPLIGFVGAPFTVATYAVEGGPSRHVERAKQMMYEAPDVWHALLERLTTALGDFMEAQVRAGAQAIQVFDSWAGLLGAADYQRYAAQHSRALLERARTLGVPRIHFAVGAGHLLESLADAGGDVIGLDWRTPIDEGRARLGPARAIQGNLDPVALLAPRAELRQRVIDVLDSNAGRAGHIFNLGHGILPSTPVDNVRFVVDLVHEHSAR